MKILAPVVGLVITVHPALASVRSPASGTSGPVLSPIVVTPDETRAPSFDVPASVSTLNRREISRGQPQVNLSESLRAVPGVVAQNRQDYAEDLQISIRGFGALATFGVQGIRLILDGLPATMPDGQGQSQILDLPAISHMEVLRGPFALAYGNSPGGVIRAFTSDGPPVPTATVRNWWGSYGSTQTSLGFGGSDGSMLNFALTGSRFHTDGYRVHGAATRKQFYSKVRYELGPTMLTFLVNLFHQSADDPAGLTAVQLAQNPRQAGTNTVAYDARKDVHNSEGGILTDTALSPNDSLHFTFYGGTRSVLQFLPFGGAFGLSSGGVVDLSDYFYGVHGHVSHDGHLAGLGFRVSLGADYDLENEYRKGFVNDYGTQGSLRRNEFDVVNDFDQYVQARLDATRNFSFSGGLRHNLVRFDSQDFYITAVNPNDSGSTRYSHVDPMLGALYKVSPAVHVYATYGRGFQTPTFYELAYRPDGKPGLNLDLRPAVSDDYEAGIKLLADNALRVDASVFHIRTEDEILVANSLNGRTSYDNAGTTKRDGVELSAIARLPEHLTTTAALTYLDARFASGSNSGNLLPGVPRRVADASLNWTPDFFGFYTTAEFNYRDRVYVNDGNSASAGPYAVVDWWCGFRQALANLHLDEFFRIDNLFDRRYVGAVVVNDGNGRYFEPAPGRDYMVGVSLAAAF